VHTLHQHAVIVAPQTEDEVPAIEDAVKRHYSRGTRTPQVNSHTEYTLLAGGRNLDSEVASGELLVQLSPPSAVSAKAR